MGKPRLPWKRGPAAWDVKCRSDEILAQIAARTRPFMTLRGAARLLGLSTPPLRDWIAQGYLSRTGPRPHSSTSCEYLFLTARLRPTSISITQVESFGN